jgi:hypothetical protein
MSDEGEADLKKDGEQATPPGDEGKGDKPDRKSWIPRERFDQLVETVSRLAEAVAQKPPVETKKPDPPKELSRADLRRAVEAQQLTQEEADSLWDKNLLERAKSEAREAAQQAFSVTQSTQRIDTDLRRYRELVPNAWKSGTEERERVAEEYRALTSIGLPDSKETELAAMRAVFGSVENLSKKSRSRPSVEHDEQSGGGGEGSQRVKDPVAGMDSRTKAHYQKGLDSGRYKNWDEVKAELAFRKPKTA